MRYSLSRIKPVFSCSIVFANMPHKFRLNCFSKTLIRKPRKGALQNNCILSGRAKKCKFAKFCLRARIAAIYFYASMGYKEMQFVHQQRSLILQRKLV